MQKFDVVRFEVTIWRTVGLLFLIFLGIDQLLRTKVGYFISQNAGYYDDLYKDELIKAGKGYPLSQTHIYHGSDDGLYHWEMKDRFDQGLDQGHSEFWDYFLCRNSICDKSYQKEDQKQALAQDIHIFDQNDNLVDTDNDEESGLGSDSDSFTDSIALDREPWLPVPFVPRPCPCASASLCDMITSKPRKEIFAFSRNVSNWHYYDWNKLTTVVAGGYRNDSMLCHAHSKGVRVLKTGNFQPDDLPNKTARHLWIETIMQDITYNFLDGMNVDFEKAIPAHDKALIELLNELIRELNSTLKGKFPHALITFDFPNSGFIHKRNYDYRALGKLIDFAFIMDYDDWNNNYAWANSAIGAARTNIKTYTGYGIPPFKLVLGVPWYGLSWGCSTYNMKSHKCKLIPHARLPIPYIDLVSTYLPQSFTGRMWDEKAQSPYFSIKDKSGRISQIWYDDPESLSIKYKLVGEFGLRGTGMWTVDKVDYSNKTQVDSMWNILP